MATDTNVLQTGPTYKEHPLTTYSFLITDVGAGPTPVDGVVSGTTSTGILIPAGYQFFPVTVSVDSNAARTAGTSTIKVTADGVELDNGPEAVLDATNTLADTGKVSPGFDAVKAGEKAGVSATGDGSFAPTTADATVLLAGYLVPQVG